MVYLSLVPSLHSQLFFACCKKSGREPGQIRHVKCVISAGRVCGFVECSDLAALLVHMESQKSSCKFSFKLSERTVRDERQNQRVSKNTGTPIGGLLV